MASREWDVARGSALEGLESFGVSPYPHCFEATCTIGGARAAFSTSVSGAYFRVMGRVSGIRRHGGLMFFDVFDLSGSLQAMVEPGKSRSSQICELLHTGDIVGVRGRMFLTRSGEVTLRVEDLKLLAKCVQPWPDRRHGMSNLGRLRDDRHLELILDHSARQRFVARSKAISSIRRFLEEDGFLEVETPILQEVYGGAEARPFTTGCTALGNELYLRISPELHLKRLIVGGFGKVFEIGKNFRNEGLDSKHHPEFTSVEIYEEGSDYFDMMELCEAIVRMVAMAVTGGTRVISRLRGDPVEVNLEHPFRRISMLESIAENTGFDLTEMDDNSAVNAATRLEVEVRPGGGWDDAVLAIFERFVERTLLQPTFVMDYPARICPLTKQHRGNQRLAERFELFIHGLEFANAYSELTDPREQQRHFDEQIARRTAGDELAHPPDSHFVEALAWGMPPTGGLGIGLDRLMMLMTETVHIQDMILFPLRKRGYRRVSQSELSPESVGTHVRSRPEARSQPGALKSETRSV